MHVRKKFRKNWIMTVEEVGADVGSSTTAVVGSSKRLLFGSEKNYGVKANDQIAFTSEDCSDADAHALTVDEDASATVLFEKGAASHYTVCYKFQNQPWIRLSTMRVFDVLSMKATCEGCSDDTSVMYLEKEFTFEVNGNHESGVEEYAKWVYGDEGCEGKSALLSQV